MVVKTSSPTNQLQFITIDFEIIRGKQFSTTARKYKVSKEGKQFLSNRPDLQTLPPSINPVEYKKKSSGNKQSTTRKGRGLHHLPKIRNAMSSTDNWFEMTGREDYEFPSFFWTLKDIGYCKNIKDMKGFRSHQRPHFMWEDNKLAKRHTMTKRCEIKIEGKNTNITLRHAACEGIKVCSFPHCTYAVSNRQKKNKYQSHAGTHKLQTTGHCPAQLIYAWPTNDDGRRWIGIIPSPNLKHNYSRLTPHHISQDIKYKIENALKNDTSLTTKEKKNTQKNTKTLKDCLGVM